MQSFWTFQAVFWVFIFFWRMLYNLAHGFDVSWDQVLPRLISISLSAILVLGLGHLAVRIMPRQLRIGRLILIVLSSLIFALFVSFIDRSVFSLSEGKFSWSEIILVGMPMHYFFSAWMFVSWVVLFLLIGQFSRLRDREAAIYSLKNAAKEARMKMLVHQLNPHFLFNTLNSVSALINETRAEDADLMITRLSRFLRHVVDPKPSELIPLAQEMTILHDYIDIQSVRYGEQLQVETDCADTSVCDALVPKMILQPLIENSIKYGRLKAGHTNRINVSAKAIGSRLIVRVEDNGPGFPPTINAKGLGLRLVEERLEAHFGDAADLSIRNLDVGGCRVEIRLPFMRAEPDQEGDE